jgi:hypothetical protein
LKHSLEVYDCPGNYLNDVEFLKLNQEILSVAKECLDEIPDYQCLTGKREEYKRLIIAVARNEEGKMLGFCSSYLLTLPSNEFILHLGLTCVRPEGRKGGLTHKLTGKVVKNYILRYSLFRTSWISNVACVLSSLGNVALHFDEVYPSPFVENASSGHKRVSSYIDQFYRNELYVPKSATFNSEKFIFENSVSGTMFEKSETDRKFHHRDQDLTRFYASMINFNNGDEVLQIGKVSLLTFPKYLIRNFMKKRMLKPNLITNSLPDQF